MKNNKAITIVIIFICSIAMGLFYSCENSVNNGKIDNETSQRIRTMLMTPDSLRSPEDKALFQKIEAIVYEKCIIKNDRFELTISKNEVKAMGIPEVCYDMVKKDIANINDGLDSPNFPIPRQEVFDGFQKSKDEYFVRKESQHPE